MLISIPNTDFIEAPKEECYPAGEGEEEEKGEKGGGGQTADDESWILFCW